MRDRTGLLSGLMLVIVAALAYLPFMNQVGYSHDDWYLMASARAEGPGVFREIYSVDRPLRAYVLAPLYAVFGGNVFYYNLSAWFFRVLSALCFLWLLHRLWPGHARWTFLMALLYIVYPGFLSQLNGIDYQSQIISLAAACFSLASTVYAFFERRPAYKLVAISVAVITGILYLGLVEYEVGFEFIRLILLFILAGRLANGYRERIFQTVKLWLPYSLILFGFGIWRLFFFHSERSATDVDLQFSQFRSYPLQTVYHWAIQVIQDSFDVTLAAWVTPLSQVLSYMRPLSIGLAILAIGLVLFALYRLREGEVHSKPPPFDVKHEALLLGLGTIIGGLVPIAMVNREVWFPSFSRYSLVSSIGVAILIPAILMYIRNRVLQNVIGAALCLVAIFTHHAIAIKQAQETAIIRNFWWQVAWRVPQFEESTTLVANIPGLVTEEDYFIWGPASLIYYPQKQNPKVIQPGLFAAILNQDTVTKIKARERQEYDNRKNIITYKNYRNFILINQPSPDSCVHVINGASPEYSSQEPDFIRTISSYSEIEHVLLDETPHTPPEVVFGPEPAHGWCYYYQKADLARQKGDWDEVIRIGNQVIEQNLNPTDPIEWMPFLQAFAQTGNVNRLKQLASMVSTDPSIARQACQILRQISGLSAEVTETSTSVYCNEP
jgi:hypothetical protein